MNKFTDNSLKNFTTIAEAKQHRQNSREALKRKFITFAKTQHREQTSGGLILEIACFSQDKPSGQV